MHIVQHLYFTLFSLTYKGKLTKAFIDFLIFFNVNFDCLFKNFHFDVKCESEKKQNAFSYKKSGLENSRSIMKALEENYKIFVLLGICPSDKPISRWMEIVHISISVFCAIFLIGCLISSSVYCLNTFLIDLGNGIFSVCQILGNVTSLYFIIIAHIIRHDIKKVFNDVQAFDEASK